MDESNKNMVDKEGIRIIRMSGDITQVSSDAIIAAINSGRLWFGGIDGAIQRVAGNIYHSQAAKEELYDLKVIVARGDHNQHHGKFDNVVFVVDDLKSPLRTIIARGLEVADAAGFKRVAIPAIRTGVMLGAIESFLGDVVDEWIAGVREYIIRKTVNDRQNPGIQAIIFVIYNNPELEEILRRAIKDQGW